SQYARREYCRDARRAIPAGAIAGARPGAGKRRSASLTRTSGHSESKAFHTAVATPAPREPPLGDGLRFVPAVLGQVGHLELKQREHSLHAVPVVVVDMPGELAFLLELHLPPGLAEGGNGITSGPVVVVAQADGEHGCRPLRRQIIDRRQASRL